MKRFVYNALFILAICLFVLTACGKDSPLEYYDFSVEEREVFDSQLPGQYYGFQFYEDETAQIMLGKGKEWEGVWLLKADGSSKQLLPGYEEFLGSWFLTSQGQSILFYDSAVSGNRVQILDREGRELSSREGVSGRSVCETKEGRVYLLAEENDNVFLAEINLTTGGLRRLEGLELNLERRLGLNSAALQCLGTGSGGLMLMDCDGVWEITEKESGAEKRLMLSFESTSYMDMISDPVSNPNFYLRIPAGFRMLEDGSVELLWKYMDSGRGLLQTLRYEKTEKAMLRLRCLQVSAWLAQCITEFNRASSDYFVVLEQPDGSAAWEEFAERTDLEIGAGKGADLILGQASRNFSALVEKGAFLDLTSCLEGSGIVVEDYFPIAFAREEGTDVIYGVKPSITVTTYWVSSQVLEDPEGMDINAVVDALNEYPGKGSFEWFPPRAILMFFLQGSEDFWGMVDYEKGTCNFDTELFAKILNTAKRYSEKASMDSPAVVGFRQAAPLGAFVSTRRLQEQGKTALGGIFDDGIFPMSLSGDLLAINADSANPEGCGEFLSFLLQEEAQRNMQSVTRVALPAHRGVFEERQRHELEWSGRSEPVTDTNFVSHGECTQEDAAEQLELMESLRALPMDTQHMQNIIWDEAKEYLEGIRPMEAVIDHINNRVQLYLNENK